jgi:hypothetical protein
MKQIHALGTLLFVVIALIMTANSLTRTASVVSSEPVFTPSQIGLCRTNESSDMGVESETECEGELTDLQHHRAHPIPIIWHVFGGSVMLIAGVFTLNTGLRVRRPALHRAFGYAFVFASLFAGTTTLWMNYMFPDRFSTFNYLSNYVWGGALTIIPFIALYHIFNRNFAAHRAWMIRNYCVAAGPATHRLLFFTYIGPFEYLGDIWDICLSVFTILIGELFIRRVNLRRIIPRAFRLPT